MKAPISEEASFKTAHWRATSIVSASIALRSKAPLPRLAGFGRSSQNFFQRLTKTKNRAP
jgi:hypothetical protein